MQYKKTIAGLILICGCISLLTGCYKDKTVFLDSPAITRTVTFSQDIIPIFNKSCNTSGCHSAGGQTPDLTTSKAFNALTVGNYYDKNAAENSIIYKKMSGKMGTVMPVSGMNADYNALILAWIKQGAKNN
ncbi:hypothetical protein BH11BAC3_BH11BAC3_17530 [soil metagenome]